MSLLPSNYSSVVTALKERIRKARQRAILSVNKELTLLYWEIGEMIITQQGTQGWGAKVIQQLSIDLKTEFPDFKGLSERNLKYMATFARRFPQFGQQPAVAYFAEHCPTGQFGQQLAAQLPWFHIVTLLTKLDDSESRAWYATQAAQHGWSRTTLEVNIRNRLRQRQGAAVTNFDARLQSPHSQLAHETLKDPYLFDFLGLGNDAHEREIETGLVRHITQFCWSWGRALPLSVANIG